MQLRKKHKSNYGNRMTRKWLGMCMIPLLFVIVFSYIPMFGAIIAFKDYRYDRGILGSEWVGFKNFEFFFKSDTFLRITYNTLKYNILFIIVGTACAVGLALLLYGLTSRRKTKIFQTILITPHFMSWVVVASMAYAILKPGNGFLNVILGWFNIEPVNWYGETGAWTPILTISYLWKTVGMDAIIYYAALMGIDNSYIEAAKVDGANNRQITLKIIIPFLVSLITTLTVLKVGNIFRADFGLFYQVPRNIGTLFETTDVVDTYIYRSMKEIGDMGMSTAIGLLQSAVGFVLVVITNKISKKIDPNSGLF